MSARPEEALGPFLESLLEERRPAWLRTTRAGEVISGEGELSYYGLAELAEGERLGLHLDVLEGLFPLEPGTYQLPHLHLAGNLWVDVHLLVRHEEVRVLLLDASYEVEHKSRMQQRGNDLALLVEKAGRSPLARPVPLGTSSISQQLDDAGVLAELLSELFVVALERLDEPGLFRWLGAPADPRALWLSEALDDEDLRTGTIHLADSVPFLENFLIDAEEHWSSKATGAVRSGAWVRQASDGSEIALEAQAITVRSGGRRRRLLLVQRLDQAFEERQTLIQRARETSLDYERMRKEVERKEILLHCIVHDLKGPLAAMMGGLSLLRSPSLDPEKRDRLIEVGLAQSKQQEELIRTILEVFSAEVDALRSFSTDWETAPDVLQCATKALESYATAFEEKEIEVRLDGEDSAEPLKAAGDSPRLVRILQNLFENASRHAPRASTLHVRLRSEASDSPEVAHGWVVIEVRDEGPGVPPEIARGLFDKFGSQKSGDRSHVGAGLGLYFCRMTVEQWGGEIAYVEGRGATFRVRLPRVTRES